SCGTGERAFRCSDVTAEEIRKLLGRPELARMFAAVRHAFETRGTDGARSALLSGLSTKEKRAIADLHGWREVPSADRLTLSFVKLDLALRSSIVGLGLLDTVVALGGSLKDRRAARAEELSAREEMWRSVRAEVSARPELVNWIDELRARGHLTRSAALADLPESVLLARALSVMARLPASGVPLAVLATELFGDAHALDTGTSLAALVLRGAAALVRWNASPASAAERRNLWAEVGVACDPLSSDVLTLGLWPVGEGLLARHLRECSSEGEPRRVTLRELMKASVDQPPGSELFVCENPTVVAAAADRLGSRCAPLVCLEGVPSTAGLRLLLSADKAGARIRFRADFDWAGLRICNLVRTQLTSAIPWRMNAADYEQAVQQRDVLLELIGAPVAASWDDGLHPALLQRGVGVPEESLLSSLLEDLDTRVSPS
ncbi:MAG: TIGR02679 family protein, partial [Myxococcaceae bacterium]